MWLQLKASLPFHAFLREGGHIHFGRFPPEECRAWFSDGIADEPVAWPIRRSLTGDRIPERSLPSLVGSQMGSNARGAP